METFDQPVWLLDVDGVIFPETARPGWGAAPRKVFVHQEEKRYAIQLIKEIRDIIKSGQAEVRWTTTWINDNDVAHLEKMFSFPPLKRAFISCSPGGMREKMDAARRVVQSDRKLIWTDDNVVPLWGPFYDELTAGGRTLLIQPDPRKGLRPEDLIAIREFIGISVSA